MSEGTLAISTGPEGLVLLSNKTPSGDGAAAYQRAGHHRALCRAVRARNYSVKPDGVAR